MAEKIETISVENLLTLEEFLEQVPPNQPKEVTCSITLELPNLNLPTTPISRTNYLTFPDIQLHCNSIYCSGMRFFRCIDGKISVQLGGKFDEFLNYVCRNCREVTKKFALNIYIKSLEPAILSIMKLGEIPVFGPNTPSRVISLIGPDRETFIKGRRAENHGLGIGAFAYYRRVVENQKGRLIREMGQAAQNLGAEEEDLKKFEKAAKETQFSRAIEDVKDAIPQSLLIRGCNPLSLLHSALSEGLHDKSDEECLELAKSIRIVLTEMAERISQALKDEVELKQAISSLLKVKNNN